MRVLIVEDNPGDLFLVEEILSNTSINFQEIARAADLTSAQTLLLQNNPEVILLDLSLPDSQGVNTLRAITQMKPEGAIIILSGHHDQKLLLEALKEGAEDYLIKGETDARLLEKTIRYAVERKAFRLQLIHSEEKYKNLFDHSPLPICAFEIESRKITMVNASASQFYGYSLAEFCSLKTDHLIIENDRSLMEEEFARQNRRWGVHYAGEWRHVHKSGRLLDVEIVTHDIMLDGKRSRLMVVYDIAERKQHEGHLRLLESVIINTGDGVMITDLSKPLKVIYTNEAFNRMSGYTSLQMKGKSPETLFGALTNKEEFNKVKRALEKAMPIETELVQYTSAGKPYWVHMQIIPVYNRKNELTNFVAIQRDVTQRKKMEIERERITQDLMDRNKELEQFTYIISHNLRAPLANIIGLSSLMQEENDERSNQLFAKELQHASEKLDSIIQDLNKILRSKNTNFLQKEEIQLEPLMKEVLEGIVPGEHVKIYYDFSALPHVVSVKTYMYSIFLNLISNSIKYRRPNVDCEISVVAQAKEHKAEIVFSDNGLGIDLSKYGHKVFGLYKRFHPHIDGKGMGLFMVKTQAQALGGAVSLDSSPSQGTRVRLELPINV